MAPTCPPLDALDAIKFRDERETISDLLSNPPLQKDPTGTSGSARSLFFTDLIKVSLIKLLVSSISVRRW